MFIPAFFMMLAMSACYPQTADTGKNEGNEVISEAPGFEGGEEFAFLKSIELVTSFGTVSGDIDEENNIVAFRHLPMGTSISSAKVDLVDGAELLTTIEDSFGNWPEELKIVIRKDDNMSSYTLKLLDYVGADDEFYLNDPEWSLEWADEFNTDDIDWSVWEYCPRQEAEWANKMSARADLTIQRDGNLEVWAKNNDNISEDSSPYVTGGLWGEGLKSFAMGRIDVRAKKDFAYSFWPAIWMMPDANIPWPDGGEIDIMEHLNYEPVVYQTVHSYYTENISKNDPVDHSTTLVDTREYHVYSVEVYEDRLVYYVDNKPQLEYRKDESKTGQYPFSDYDFYMILSAQLGGSWPGEATGKDLPAAMYVDFVRYYAPTGK